MRTISFNRLVSLGALLGLLPLLFCSCAEQRKGDGRQRRVVDEQSIEIGVGQKRVFSGIDELVFSEPCKIAVSGGTLEIRGTLSRPLVVSLQKLSFDLSESALLIFEHVVFRMSGEYAKFPPFIHASGSSVLVRHCEFSCLQYRVFLDSMQSSASVEDVSFDRCFFFYCFLGPVANGLISVKDAIFEDSCLCDQGLAMGTVALDGVEYAHPKDGGYIKCQAKLLRNSMLTGNITVSACRIEWCLLKVSDVICERWRVSHSASVIETEIWLGQPCWPYLLQHNSNTIG